MVEGDEKERLKQAGLTQERALRGGACCRPDHGGCATRTPEFTWLSLLLGSEFTQAKALVSTWQHQ